MSIGKKNVFIMGGLFFLIGTFCLVLTCNFWFKDNSKIDKYEEVYQSTIDRNLFGMYVEDENGDYVEYTKSDLFPDNSKYILNEESSYCVDNTDQIVENVISYNNGKVSITSNKTLYCYLYFSGINDDLVINVSTDGVENVVPTIGIYNRNLNCSSGNAYYNSYYHRIEIGSFKRGTKCDLVYTKNTSLTNNDKLSVIVQNYATTNVNGYRYSGENPNNYVWFNNEYWRIIGLVPVCTTAASGTCSSRTNLVKIIRANSIGGFAFDDASDGLWGNNTLYTLLNNYYYGKKDGTGTEGCYGMQTSSPGTRKLKCDYTTIGVSNSDADYYGKMVKSVYWNIGTGGKYNVVPNTIYTNEITKVTSSSSKIGLMSASDYGYAAVVSGYSTTLNSYGTAAVTGTNWLVAQGEEYTISPYNDSSLIYIQMNYYVGMKSASRGAEVRPVIYLDSEVYKLGGSGTMADPYIIGM